MPKDKGLNGFEWLVTYQTKLVLPLAWHRSKIIRVHKYGVEKKSFLY